MKTEGLLSVLPSADVSSYGKAARALFARHHEAGEEAGKHDLDGILTQIDTIGRADNRRKLELLKRIQDVDCDKHEAAVTALRQADTEAADLACKIIAEAVPAHLPALVEDLAQQEARLHKFGVPLFTPATDQKGNAVRVWRLHADPVAAEIYFDLWSLAHYWAEEFQRPRWAPEGSQWSFLIALFPPPAK